MRAIRLQVPAVFIALLLTGCVPATPRLDARFSDATRTLNAEQVLDPDASQRNATRPVSGVEGRAARETMDRYYRSFSQPQRASSGLTINVGGAGGGGADAQ